jgi:flagellar secretion chaperone FliS
MNAYAAPQLAYQRTQIQSASPTELVVMLYRGAIRFAKAGIDGVKRNDVEAAHTGFVRAQDIVNELSGTLNFEGGGEIATQLRAIYDFVIGLLMQANISKSIEPAEQAVGLLQELLSGWEQVGRA